MTRLLCLAFLLIATVASAQRPPLIGTAGASVTQIAFENNDVDLATAASYTYRVTIDGAPGVVTAVVCTRLGVINTCLFPLPSLTSGVPHTLTITAATNATSGESGPSAPFTFTLEAIPSPPTNLHIAPKSGIGS